MNGYGCVPIKFYFKNRWQAEFGPRTVVCQSLLRMKLIKILVIAMLPLLQQIHPLLPNQQILLWKFPHVPPCINLSFSIRCKLVISPILKNNGYMAKLDVHKVTLNFGPFLELTTSNFAPLLLFQTQSYLAFVKALNDLHITKSNHQFSGFIILYLAAVNQDHHSLLKILSLISRIPQSVGFSSNLHGCSFSISLSF